MAGKWQDLRMLKLLLSEGRKRRLLLQHSIFENFSPEQFGKIQNLVMCKLIVLLSQLLNGLPRNGNPRDIENSFHLEPSSGESLWKSSSAAVGSTIRQRQKQNLNFFNAVSVIRFPSFQPRKKY